MATHACQRLSRSRIIDFLTHRMEMRLESIIMAVGAKRHDVGSAQQSLIVIGMWVVASCTIFKRSRMLYAAGKLAAVMAGQAGIHFFLQLQGLAVTDVRSMAIDAAVKVVDWRVHYGPGQFGRKRFMAIQTEFFNSRSRCSLAAGLVTLITVTCCKRGVFFWEQQGFYTLFC